MTNTQKSGKSVKAVNVEKKQEKKQAKNTKEETQQVVEAQPEQKAEKKQSSEEKCEEQFKNIRTKINKLRSEMKDVLNETKRASELHRSAVKNAKSTKKNEKKRDHKATGFARLRPVTGKLAEFISVDSNTELSGPAITKRVWAELKNRGLTFQGDDDNKKDERVLRVDNEVSKLFNVPMSVNKSTNHRDENGLNFGNLQKYIKNAMGVQQAPVENKEQKHQQKKNLTK
jgi:hypothetical protein